MEIVIGVILYLVIVSAFMAFGKFIKECDETAPKPKDNVQ